MNRNKIKISVVVISFNGEEFIEDCLQSLFASPDSDQVEIVIIDNGSSDRTIDIIESKFKKSTLIKNSANLGFAPAVNQGLKTAQGDYILILNQDTKIVDDALFKLALKMKSDTTIGSIGPKFVGFDGVLQKANRAFPKYRDLIYEFIGFSALFPNSKIFGRWKMGWFDHLTEMAVDQPMGAALMISRDTINRIGYFDESFRIFFNDVDYCRRISEAGLKNLYYPSAEIAHFVGGSTRKNKPEMILESHRAMYQYFRKYNKKIWGKPALWAIGILLYVSAQIRAALT